MWNSVDPLGPLLYFQVQHYDKRTTAGITVMTKVSRLILLRNEGPCQPIRVNPSGKHPIPDEMLPEGEAEPKLVAEKGGEKYH